ncbi:membrane protein [Deltaproteobacteria bacterium]|nr:membrane protein [Deltaproteobacteria bacterium]
MPASGLLALLDDIASIADDVATLSMAAAKKTSGIVTDDMAVTAEQAIGIRREREIPVVLAVAKGSFKNKALILAPAALALNAVAPWAITPLLMLGGSYLAYEGVEKVLHAAQAGREDADEQVMPDPETFEKGRIAGAIRTDLILSAEIIAISLGEVAAAPFLSQVIALYLISVIMTVGVYGIVGVLVKLDDMGEYLFRFGGRRAWLGNILIVGTPKLLHAISVIGTVAMLMVGGHIVLKGITPAYHAVEGLLSRLPFHWLFGSIADVLAGALVGVVVVAGVTAWKRIRAMQQARSWAR